MDDGTEPCILSDEDRAYHSARAQDELRRGLVAEDIVAARAHLALATMHLRRSRGPACGEPLLRM